MIIEHFASNQNEVFLLGLVAVLVATVAVCGPIVFAPALHRAGRLKAVGLVAGVLAAGALTAAAWQAGIGFRVLGEQRSLVQAEVEQRYGLQLTGDQANELVNGGAPPVSLSDRAASIRASRTGRCDVLQFVQRTVKVAGEKNPVAVTDTYDLHLDRKRLPAIGSGSEPAAVCDPNPPKS